MLWWQSILRYWFSELLEVTDKSFVSFLHWLRMIVLMVSMLSWLIFTCFPLVFWERIQIHIFLYRKARHFTTPWSKCDVLIWAQPVSSDKTFSPRVVRRRWRESRVHTLQNLDYLFPPLKFDWHGDHFWLRCVTRRPSRCLRTSHKQAKHQEPQLPRYSWPVSVFRQLCGMQLGRVCARWGCIHSGGIPSTRIYLQARAALVWLTRSN